MAASLGGFEVNSLGESGMVVENKTLTGKSDDVYRVLVGEANIIDGSLKNGANGDEFGRMDYKDGGSSFSEMLVYDNDFTLDMIGRDLDQRFGFVDTEARGCNGSKSAHRGNLIGDLNLWRETVGDATNGQGICINGSAVEGLDLVNPACPRGGGDSEKGERIGGGKLFTAATTFFPDELVNFVSFVATHPSRKIGTLHVAQKKKLN